MVGIRLVAKDGGNRQFIAMDLHHRVRLAVYMMPSPSIDRKRGFRNRVFSPDLGVYLGRWCDVGWEPTTRKLFIYAHNRCEQWVT